MLRLSQACAGPGVAGLAEAGPGSTTPATSWAWRLRGRAFVLLGLQVAALSLAAPQDVALSRAVPRRGDHTLLSWREGPPYLTNFRPEDAANSRYSAERRFLRLATGHFTADFDTEKIAIPGLAWHASPEDEDAAVRATLAAQPLPPAQLQLEIRVGDAVYVCSGRGSLALDARGMPKQALEFPVRVIESGRFFQKFTLHDLEFRGADGQRLPVDSRLEVSAWPDRLVLVLVVKPREAVPSARLTLRLQTSAGTQERVEATGAAWREQREHRAVLMVGAPGGTSATSAPVEVSVRIAAADPRGRATVAWNPEEASHTIRLEAPPWPKPPEGIYPESQLDAWEEYAVTLENRSDGPQEIGLNFDHTPVKSIWSYVPMIVDAGGRPSGIPVQISKNWHKVKTGLDPPYAGGWMHGRTRLHLPANARLTFGYGTTFARWGGVPTASLAQLSLVGWGHNGFWDQFALGGFGESICFQPARVMRRSLLTDFRPLFQRGFAKNERWAWTGNVGGGDTMVRIDPQGRYVPFKRNVTRYASPGPNLAHLIYDELSADDAIRSRVEVMLPRTDDGVRVYVRVHYEVSRRVEFSRLALFQLGADFYNDTDDPLIAWGDAGGLAAEHRPQPEPGKRVLPAWVARGEQPWLSLHGGKRDDLQRTGQASRGLVVREWRAVLGGRPVPAPCFAAVGSLSSKSRLAAEIVPPPELSALEAGDFVDLLVEMLALPLTAERYYGPDPAFAAALAAGANTWKMVHREAEENRPTLQLPEGREVRGWPLDLPIAPGGETSFVLRGGLGWVPVRLTGVSRADAVELWRVGPGGREPVVQGDPARAFWQADYDVAAGSWNLTYNLPATPSPTHYVARWRVAREP